MNIKNETPEETRTRHTCFLEHFGLASLGVLGKGSFGIVYEVRDGEGQTFAAKVIDEDPQMLTLGIPEAALREASLYHKMSLHPNILRLHRVLYDPDLEVTCAVLLLEIAPLGSLDKVINSFWEPQEPPCDPERIVQQLRIARELATGLAHAHANGILFIDLKPANVLVFADYHIKLADLGGADRLEAKQYTGKYALSTLSWRSPEEVCDREYIGKLETRRDSWSLGIVYLQLFFGVNSAIYFESHLFPTWVKMIGPPPADSLDCLQKKYLEWKTNKSKSTEEDDDDDDEEHDQGVKQKDKDTTTISPARVCDAAMGEREPHSILNFLDSDSQVSFREVYYGPELFASLIQLIDSLLQWSPHLRCTAAAVLSHPVFTSNWSKSSERLEDEKKSVSAVSTLEVPTTAPIYITSSNTDSPPSSPSVQEINKNSLLRDERWMERMQRCYPISEDTQRILQLADKVLDRYRTVTDVDKDEKENEEFASVLIAIKLLNYVAAFYIKSVLPMNTEQLQTRLTEWQIVRVLDWNLDGSTVSIGSKKRKRTGR